MIQVDIHPKGYLITSNNDFPIAFVRSTYCKGLFDKDNGIIGIFPAGLWNYRFPKLPKWFPFNLKWDFSKSVEKEVKKRLLDWGASVETVNMERTEKFWCDHNNKPVLHEELFLDN